MDLKTNNSVPVPPAPQGNNNMLWSNLNAPGAYAPKKSKKSILNIGGLILLVVSVFVWGGLKAYQYAVADQIKGVRQEQAKIFSAEEKELAQKMVDLKNRASLLLGYLNNHVYSSKILDSLGDNTLRQVKWDNFNLSVKDLKVGLNGRAGSYSVLARQLLALSEAKYFKDISISAINLDKSGSVTFGLVYTFDPAMMKN